MARDRGGNGAPPESVISIIGPGMKVVGDCVTDGTIRIEGTVDGAVTAGKAVVVGKDGFVSGGVITQDAVVAGRVVGSLIAESRLELQATSRLEGEVYARRLQLEEGAVLNGTVDMGERPRKKALEAAANKAAAQEAAKTEGAEAEDGADAPAEQGAPAEADGSTPAAEVAEDGAAPAAAQGGPKEPGSMRDVGRPQGQRDRAKAGA